MEDRERKELENLTLAPYLQKATALIGQRRRVGGNQFRHAMATLAILIDYHFTDPVLLKASVIHDLFEDVPGTNPRDIASLDDDGEQVVQLVLEVTRGSEPKNQYLQRLCEAGSKKAKILKVADRLSNLTDLHRSVFTDQYICRYIEETAQYIVPFAREVNSNMAVELEDLIRSRLESIETVISSHSRETGDCCSCQEDSSVTEA